MRTTGLDASQPGICVVVFLKATVVEKKKIPKYVAIFEGVFSGNYEQMGT